MNSMYDLSRYTDDVINLELLAEEASEVIQAKSKLIRFGQFTIDPDTGMTNSESLGNEIGNLMYIVEILLKREIISRQSIINGMNQKDLSLKRYYRYPHN